MSKFIVCECPDCGNLPYVCSKEHYGREEKKEAAELRDEYSFVIKPVDELDLLKVEPCRCVSRRPLSAQMADAWEGWNSEGRTVVTKGNYGVGSDGCLMILDGSNWHRFPTAELARDVADCIEAAKAGKRVGVLE